MNIEHYITESGRDPFQDWLDSLKDTHVRIAALRRVDHAFQGNLGDHKSGVDGISEMRLNVSPGYRIYFFQHGLTLIVLLCGGKKDRQGNDISKAISFREDYLRCLARKK